MTFLYDIIIVLILAFFAWRGAKKGLILSLCALIGIVLAFFGARFVSAEFHEPVADIIEPPIYQSILGMEKNDQEKAAINAVDTYSLDELLDMIKNSDLYDGLLGFLEDAVDSEAIQGEGNAAAKALAGYLATVIAKAALFSITFLVIVFVWFLLSHLLDLTFKLPGLSAVNLVGGLVLGLVKAVLLVVVLVWIAQICGLIPNPPTTPVVSLFTPEKILTMLNDLIS